MKRLKDVLRFERAEVPTPDERAVGDDALLRDRERWRPVLERILALANELHPASRYDLKAEAQRLWNRLELGPIPTFEKSERTKIRERIAQQQRRKRGHRQHRLTLPRLWK